MIFLEKLKLICFQEAFKIQRSVLSLSQEILLRFGCATHFSRCLLPSLASLRKRDGLQDVCLNKTALIPTTTPHKSCASWSRSWS